MWEPQQACSRARRKARLLSHLHFAQAAVRLVHIDDYAPASVARVPLVAHLPNASVQNSLAAFDPAFLAQRLGIGMGAVPDRVRRACATPTRLVPRFSLLPRCTLPSPAMTAPSCGTSRPMPAPTRR